MGGKKKADKNLPNFLSEENLFESEENFFEDEDEDDDLMSNETSKIDFEDSLDNSCEKYPWDFLENSGFFTLVGSSLPNLNDRVCILVNIR